MVFNVSFNYTKKIPENQLHMREYISHSSEQTTLIAREMAQKNQNGGCFCLHGDLGAGKTVFVKGFAKGLHMDPKMIKSPTYTYLRSYKLGKKFFHHFDFYRIENTDDLIAHDLEEIFSHTNAWILIEWPERVENLLPQERTDIFFEYISENVRKIIIKP